MNYSIAFANVCQECIGVISEGIMGKAYEEEEGESGEWYRDKDNKVFSSWLKIVEFTLEF